MSSDRFDLYELCLQSPPDLAAFIHAVHGHNPAILAEDFCGTAALSRAWVARDAPASALATDLDPETLAQARVRAARVGLADRIRFIRADCTAPDPAAPAPCDAVFTGNFSIGYIHHRPALLAYLRRSLARLRPRGLFICDTYGGASAFRAGGVERLHPLPPPSAAVVRFLWLHERADLITGMVENSAGFRIEVPAGSGQITHELSRAFTYRWRLWPIAELREAVLEAGFGAVEVYNTVRAGRGPPPAPITDPAALGEDWTVLIVARS